MALGKICILYRRRLFLETTGSPGVPSFVEIIYIDCEKIYFCNLRAMLPARFSTNQDLPLYDGECCV